MKAIKNIILIFSLLTLINIKVSAQGPPPPPGENGNGGDQPTEGGGAPIGGGLETLLILGFAYGTKKTYQVWKKNTEELEA